MYTYIKRVLKQHTHKYFEKGICRYEKKNFKPNSIVLRNISTM